MEAVVEDYFFKDYPFLMELVAGGCCGLAVDSCLFPIDTCKTRLQSEEGFMKAGGFKDIYNGLMPVLAGSVPIAATFFCIYAIVKSILYELIAPGINPDTLDFCTNFFVNSVAASAGEMCAGLIRTPIEIVKQRRQVSEVQFRAIDILMHAYKTDGLMNGVYRGYGVTIMRDIPFSMIQYPLWELLKRLALNMTGQEPAIFTVSCFGSVAGAVAAAITCPLDVAKTRIQLADLNAEQIPTRNPLFILRRIFREDGVAGLFGGFVPRVAWTTIGGFIWFGTYSLVIMLLKKL